MWSLRLIYELSTANAASFLTLTYNDENLPDNYGLNKKDLQDFWKRLRINLKREYHEFAPEIRYYAVGEYGSRTKRPHYHAIVFGLDDMNDKHREITAKSWGLCDDWFFDKSRGRASAMQEVTPEDINYVCGYVQKKLDGELGKKEYGDKLAPFSCCSQGIGLEFANQNRERLLTNGWTYFKGHKVSLPKYYCDKFGVKKSDYVNNQVSPGDIKENAKELFERFKEYAIKNHVWYPENPKMMEHRFKLWYERGEYEFAKIIYNDFLQRRSMKNKE